MNALKIEKWNTLGLTLLSGLTYAWIAYYLDRSHFYELFGCFALVFATYLLFIKKAKVEKLSFYLVLGVVFRLIFILSIPTLSDDYFRFIWDGQLLANGLNPFDQLPSAVSLNFPNKVDLLNGMNSPNYYTIYPPLAQLVYWLSVKLSPNSILGSIVVIRSILILAEVGVIVLLPGLLSLLKIKPINALWYALNPLVIVEVCGNLHFEGLVAFFLLLAFYMLALHKNKLASMAWALAAATKLIPILLLPILLRKLTFKKTVLFYTLFGLLIVFLFWPFYNSSFISNFFESIRLYSKSFEFNASIYYLVREIGYRYTGYNPIQSAGPWLAVIAYLGIFIILLKRKISSWTYFFPLMLFALSWYYLFALIVHPWYSINLVFLAVFTQFRYPMLWSFLAILSYSAYSNPSFQENHWLIALEYLAVVAYGIWEFLNKKKAAA